MGVVLVCPTEAQAGKGRGQVGWKVWREVRLGRAVLMWAWQGGQLAHRGHQVL